MRSSSECNERSTASITSDLQRGDLQLIQLDPLHLVAYELEVALEILSLDDYRASAIVRVKTERLSLQEVLVEEEDHVVLFIVDQTKWANATGFESEVFEHTFGAGEGEFARGVFACGKERSFEALLQVMDS